ncbi:MAG: hypothetical protein JWR69_166 [Pedosphaera sp.]|nr:hypothetical protein [Pedosphaera sp.]
MHANHKRHSGDDHVSNDHARIDDTEPGPVRRRLSLTGMLWSALLMVMLVSAGGCSPRERKIEGQVFIVTKGSQNIKLGLVAIHLLTEAQANTLVTNASLARETDISELKAGLPFLARKNEAAQAHYRQLQKKYEIADAAVEDAIKNGRFGYTKREAWDFQRPALTPDDLQRLQAARQKYAQAKAGGSYLSFEGEQVQSELERLERDRIDTVSRQKLWDTWRPVYLERLKECGNLNPEIEDAQQEFDQLTARCESFKARLSRWSDSGGMSYMQHLPSNPAETTKSDGDGRFSFLIPGKGRFAIAATASRSVSDTSERYCWLLWITDQNFREGKVILSNDDTITEHAPNAVISWSPRP